MYFQPETEHSAAIGAAYRAFYSAAALEISFEDATSGVGELQKLASSNLTKADFYRYILIHR